MKPTLGDMVQAAHDAGMKVTFGMEPMKPPSGSWACACVKRDAAGRMTHIKMNHPKSNRCRKCKCTKPKP